MALKITLDVVTTPEHIQPLLNELDALLSQWTDGRARWGYTIEGTDESPEYPEDPA